jgi:hypothetical protein
MIKNKQAQLALFMIFGILVVVVIVIILFMSANGFITQTQQQNLRSDFQSCVEDSVQSTMMLLLDNGGLITPPNKISYKSHNYTYLCYTADFYYSCYNYYPILEHLFENQIYEKTQQVVRDCFASVLDDVEGEGYQITQKLEEYYVDLLPGKVKIEVEKEITIEGKETSQSFTSFSFEMPTHLYELIEVTQNIVNAEARNCYFDANRFMVLYPRYNLTRTDYTDSKIYTLEDRNSKEEIKFAVREIKDGEQQEGPVNSIHNYWNNDCSCRGCSSFTSCKRY